MRTGRGTKITINASGIPAAAPTNNTDGVEVGRDRQHLLKIFMNGGTSPTVTGALWGYDGATWGLVGDNAGQFHEAATLSGVNYFVIEHLGVFDRLYVQATATTGAPSDVIVEAYPVVS